MTKFEEFALRTPDQLTDDLTKLKKEQFNLRFQRATGQLENTSRIRVVRRDIARIMTMLQHKGAAQAAPAANGGTAKPPAKTRAAKAKTATKPARAGAAKPPAKRAARAKKR